MPDILTELRGQLGADAVLDRDSLRARARNYWDATPLEARALVRPRTTEDLSCIMKICYAREQTVVVHGGLTGVCDADHARSVTRSALLTRCLNLCYAVNESSNA